jgi:5-methylcytosine-specific restriction endonuclease McrA
MRFRSRKREAIYRQRRPLVAALLAERPICERCGTNPSDDVHEVVSRARGGSILDRSNLVAICRSCHRFLTDHPAQAHAEGLMKHSWDRDRWTTEREGMPE